MYHIVIWGLGADYYNLYNLIKFEEMKGNIEIAAAVSKDDFRTAVDGHPVISAYELCNYRFDYIVVTSSKYYDDIVKEAIRLGIDRDLLIPARVFRIPDFDFGEYAQLKKNPVSIISDDCWGGLIYHYLGLRFESPFINFFITYGDYLKMVSDLEFYMSKSMVKERDGTALSFTMGSLGEGNKKIYLNFNHAYTFEDAKADFDRRRERIHMNNLFVKMAYGWGGYSENVVHEFDKLPYEKKIFLTSFKVGSRTEVKYDGFVEGSIRKSLQETYQVTPYDFRQYELSPSLLGREFNIIHLLVTGEIVKKHKMGGDLP